MRYSTVAFNLIVACTSIHASPTAQSGNPWLAAPAPQQGAAAAAAPVPVAAPAPAPAASPAAAPVPASPMASPLASPAGAGAAGTANMNGQPCAADINRLASGIQQNIFIQGDEVSTTQRIVDLLQQIGNGTVTKNQMVFNMGQGLKAQLLTFVDAGVAVRVSNQAITPAGNAVTAGLAKVANAQMMELGLASSLTGDTTIDITTSQTLVKAFMKGMQQNMQNLLDATQGCMPSDVIAQRGLQSAVKAGLKATIPSPN